MSRSSAGLEALKSAFLARTPPRTGSLIVTIFGDIGLPRGGTLALSDLQEWLGAIGIEPGPVRTALSRLVSAGTLNRQRAGKAAHYALSVSARREFEAAANLIYGRRVPVPTGMMNLAVLDDVADRKRQRVMLAAQGFAALTSSAMLSPVHAGVSPQTGDGVLILEVALSSQLAERALSLWPLGTLAEGYQAFVAQATILVREAAFQSHFESLLSRLLLVHEFRRLVLRDPFLPKPLLPADWPGNSARIAFDAAYSRLSHEMLQKI